MTITRRKKILERCLWSKKKINIRNKKKILDDYHHPAKNNRKKKTLTNKQTNQKIKPDKQKAKKESNLFI